MIGRNEVAMAPIVLIADADQELRDLYRRFFSHHGWRVETASGGVDCLEHLRRDRPHVLILDWRLPWGGPDGLLAVMHDDGDLCRVPVILMSVSPCGTMPTDTSPPVAGVLPKPFSLPKLLELARAALAIRQPRER
jgi:DNA-binding NtrC family response regulator